jgi:uncharacterized membrane protein
LELKAKVFRRPVQLLLSQTISAAPIKMPHSTVWAFRSVVATVHQAQRTLYVRARPHRRVSTDWMRSNGLPSARQDCARSEQASSFHSKNGHCSVPDLNLFDGQKKKIVSTRVAS